MARIGKIARLPGNIRTQLNTRLQNGDEGRPIVHWLNSLPEVKKVLAKSFDDHPVTEQNLSDWRQGGYEEWLAHQDLLAHVEQLAANRQELQTAAQGQPLADHLATAIGFRFAAILASQGAELDEKSISQLQALGRSCQAVVKLRRSDQNAARLQFERERWERSCRQLDAAEAEAVKSRLREKLAAPVWSGLKKFQRIEQFGGGVAAQFAASYLQEIETCDDPANFKSKVLADPSLPEKLRAAAELAKNRPPNPTPMQAAMDTLDEMDAYIERKEAKAKAKAKAQPPEPSRKVRRPVRKPAAPRVHESNQPKPAPTSPLPPGPAESAPLSAGLSANLSAETSAKAEAPPCGAKEEIVPNRV